MTKPLTFKQFEFARLVGLGMSAASAYHQVYDGAGSLKSAGANACNLKKLPHVARAIEAWQYAGEHPRSKAPDFRDYGSERAVAAYCAERGIPIDPKAKPSPESKIRTGKASGGQQISLTDDERRVLAGWDAADVVGEGYHHEVVKALIARARVKAFEVQEVTGNLRETISNCIRQEEYRQALACCMDALDILDWLHDGLAVEDIQAVPMVNALGTLPLTDLTGIDLSAVTIVPSALDSENEGRVTGRDVGELQHMMTRGGMLSIDELRTVIDSVAETVFRGTDTAAQRAAFNSKTRIEKHQRTREAGQGGSLSGLAVDMVSGFTDVWEIDGVPDTGPLESWQRHCIQQAARKARGLAYDSTIDRDGVVYPLCRKLKQEIAEGGQPKHYRIASYYTFYTLPHPDSFTMQDVAA